jgi:hypothetical protein
MCELRWSRNNNAVIMVTAIKIYLPISHFLSKWNLGQWILVPSSYRTRIQILFRHAVIDSKAWLRSKNTNEQRESQANRFRTRILDAAQNSLCVNYIYVNGCFVIIWNRTGTSMLRSLDTSKLRHAEIVTTIVNARSRVTKIAITRAYNIKIVHWIKNHNRVSFVSLMWNAHF